MRWVSARIYATMDAADGAALVGPAAAEANLVLAHLYKQYILVNTITISY